MDFKFEFITNEDLINPVLEYDNTSDGCVFVFLINILSLHDCYFDELITRYKIPSEGEFHIVNHYRDELVCIAYNIPNKYKDEYDLDKLKQMFIEIQSLCVSGNYEVDWKKEFINFKNFMNTRLPIQQ